MPARAAARIASSSGRCWASASVKSLSTREVQPRVGIAERVHLEVRQQLLDGVDAAEQRRHDDHRPALLGDAVLEIEPRQPARPAQSRRQPLHGGRREVAGRQQREQRATATMRRSSRRCARAYQAATSTSSAVTTAIGSRYSGVGCR